MSATMAVNSEALYRLAQCPRASTIYRAEFYIVRFNLLRVMSGKFTRRKIPDKSSPRFEVALAIVCEVFTSRMSLAPSVYQPRAIFEIASPTVSCKSAGIFFILFANRVCRISTCRKSLDRKKINLKNKTHSPNIILWKILTRRSLVHGFLLYYLIV